MKNIKSHFVFTRKQRSGIFVLLLLIIFAQVLYYFVDFGGDDVLDNEDQQKVTALQKRIDSLASVKANQKTEIKPFNPNFISDYKGYVLGMSVEEIDRLHEFRAKGKFVNSAKEFQKVTKVSDSLLKNMKQYFKFPDWVINKNKEKRKVKAWLQNDLNKVSIKGLQQSVGLEYKLANRIINFRNRLGGYLSFEQLHDVYDLSEDKILLIKQKFELKTIPKISKININLADISELSSLVYIDYSLAVKIIDERILRDGFKTLDELKYVEGFPVEKLNRIKLYLTLN